MFMSYSMSSSVGLYFLDHVIPTSDTPAIGFLDEIVIVWLYRCNVKEIKWINQLDKFTRVLDWSVWNRVKFYVLWTNKMPKLCTVGPVVRII